MQQEYSQDILKEFHLDTSVESKSTPEFGLRMARKIISDITAPSSYYFTRNARFKINRDYAAGRMNVKAMFQDLLKMNGKENYINLIWDSIMLINTTVSRLVGRWMTKKEKINCTAVDLKSQEQKNDLKDEADFYLNNKDVISHLEKTSNAPLMPKGSFVPEDQDELDIWIQDFLRLPEEILYELGINHIFEFNGWSDVLKRRILEDSAIVGLIGTHTYMNEFGEVIVDYAKPENLVYSYSEYPDFRDTSYRGLIESWKISDIRSAYPDLSEEKLFEIAKVCKQYQYPDKLIWQSAWSYSFMRPYDDWNVDVVTYYFKTADTQNRLYKVGKDGKLYIDKLQKAPDVLYGKNQFEKPVWNMYKGVYLRDADILLEWGVQKNQTVPQDPKERGDVKFPINIYMYQNRDMRNIAVPEKIEEPVKMMILCRLKIQQLVAKMRPSGMAFNVSAARELNLGTANLYQPLDIKKILEQTGDLFFTHIDAEGNPIPEPYKELPNAGSAAQLSELVNLYNYHQQVLRDELGINEVAEGQSIKPRVGVQNVQTQMDISFNATDYMRDAVISLYEDTATNVACLLHTDVTIGAQKYREIVGEEQVKGRNFLVKIEDMPDEEQVTRLEARVDGLMQSNPQMIMYLDPLKATRYAKENVKLAELYINRCQKKAVQGQMEQAQSNAQANAQQQVASLQAKGQVDAQLKEMEGNIEVIKAKATGEASNKSAIVNMVASILSKGLPIDPSIAPLVTATIQNLMLPMIVENEQAKQAIIQQMQQIAMAQQNPQEEQQEQGGQQNPQEEQQENQMQPQVQ